MKSFSDFLPTCIYIKSIWTKAGSTNNFVCRSENPIVRKPAKKSKVGHLLKKIIRTRQSASETEHSEPVNQAKRLDNRHIYMHVCTKLHSN